MRLRSFHAKTLTEAMSQVRDAMGDDAIIVATHDEPGGVRVTAAIDDSEPEAFQERNDQFLPNNIIPSDQRAFAIDEDDVIQKMVDIMYRHGAPAQVSETIISAVVGQNKATAYDALISALQLRFKFQPLSADTTKKPLMLIGPPGMGKTLTTAKLAARSVLQSKKIAVFSTDTVRAGGIAQLEAFTRLMKTNLITADEPESLADGLSAVPKTIDQIFIDTSGCNPYDMSEMAELTGFIQACGGPAKIEPVLVLSAGIDAFESRDIAAIFNQLGAKRIIPTRLDITRRFGGILAAAERCNLAFADGGMTGSVADGLVPVTPELLADFLMGHKNMGARKDKV